MVPRDVTGPGPVAQLTRRNFQRLLVTYSPRMYGSLVATELWVRNPEYCIKECLEVGVQKIVWDRGFLHSRSIDPKRFMDLYYTGHPYRLLLVEDTLTMEITPSTSVDNPVAVYPTWSYGEEISVLEELLEYNVANDEAALSDSRTPRHLRPVPGQEHRVVLTNLPPATTGLGRKFYRVVADLQQEYPEAIIHAHGLYSFRVMFGFGYRSADTEPRIVAKKGKVSFPTGKELTYEKASEEPHWITLMGFQPHELSIPRNRCMYNIKSAQWAGQHFLENVKFKHTGFTHVDPDNPFARPQTDHLIFTKRRKAQEGDKFLCNACSLQTSCKYFRTGAICAVPDSEPQPLAQFFNTRDADSIITGLGTLLAAQTRRFEKGLESEEDDDTKLDPEVTRIGNALFDRGVVLAKLLNPALAKPAVQITNNTLNMTNAQELTASIVDALERSGIPRDQITPDMIEEMLGKLGTTQQNAIEVSATERAS